METLKDNVLGSAEKTTNPLEQELGKVAFRLPYGDDGYNVTLDDSDLNFLLKRGFGKILDCEHLSGFDGLIELEAPDLPLFVGTRSITMAPTSSGAHTLSMEVNIVTQSMVHEHRGTLSAERVFGGWRSTGYEPQPPLVDRIEDLQTTVL